MGLLNKGLKHNLKNNTTNNNNNNRHIRNIIKDTETALRNTHINDQDSIRHDIKRKLQRTQKQPKGHNNEIKTLNNVKQKLLEHNITILKADKGNINVIMDKQELNIKVEKFFTKNNITKINKDLSLIHI